jgi:hypothetical protein
MSSRWGWHPRATLGMVDNGSLCLIFLFYFIYLESYVNFIIYFDGNSTFKIKLWIRARHSSEKPFIPRVYWRKRSLNFIINFSNRCLILHHSTIFDENRELSKIFYWKVIYYGKVISLYMPRGGQTRRIWWRRTAIKLCLFVKSNHQEHGRTDRTNRPHGHIMHIDKSTAISLTRSSLALSVEAMAHHGKSSGRSAEVRAPYNTNLTPYMQSHRTDRVHHHPRLATPIRSSAWYT